MDLGIKDKVSLVFGGSKGIGLGCAHEFAREGCRTVIAARTRATIDAAVAEVRAAGGDVVGVSADCTTRDGIATAVQAATDAFGPPAILIFNVDSGPKRSEEHTSELHPLIRISYAVFFLKKNQQS